MKIAIAYLTKDRIELTKQTFGPVGASGADVLWIDGSATDEGNEIARACPDPRVKVWPNVRGGADAAIVFALTKMLEGDYDVVGLCENDVLLHDGWLPRTMGLFERGTEEGLAVGAVSPRCYDDRILIQRNGYAICHNLGAGVVLFSREAAQLILDNYRSTWWSDNRAIFAQLSGVDIGRYAAFRGEQRWLTVDWGFDAILAQHGLASLALTPCACEMIGQEPCLEEQGLALVDREVDHFRNDNAFDLFVNQTYDIRNGAWLPQAITRTHRASQNGGATLIFPHQLTYPVWQGDWRLRWSQGFGPFSWRSNEAGCALRIRVFGPCVFLVSGDKRAARIKIVDSESGYEIDPEVPPAEHGITQLAVPGHFSYRDIVMTASEGLIFYGIQCQEPQPAGNHKFDYSSLPPV